MPGGPVNPRYRWRFILVYLFFTAALGVVAARLFWVQVVKHAFYVALATEQQHGRSELPATRGTIYDRDMAPLALSRPLYNVYCLPRLIEDAEGAARLLASPLQTEPQRLAPKLKSRADSEWLARDIPGDAALKVLALGLKGVFVTPAERRFYPEGALASHVLGYVGARDNARAGVERTLNVYLEGLPGILEGGADAVGRTLPDLTTTYIPAMNGLGCVLTIDRWCQYVAERELAATCEAFEAESGAVVMMRPRTGEILALASYPTYDPNRYAAYPPDHWRNNAVMAAIEPGSVIKPFLVAAALEEGVVTPETAFNCSQPVTVGPYKISDVKPVKGPLTVTEIILRSSNIGVTHIAAALGGKKYYDYLSAFGFGAKTGIPLPAENAGILRPAEFNRALGRSFAAFGQGFSATPLQIATAACALANGGVLYEPMLLKAVVAPDGKPLRRFEPHPVRRVISPRTAREVLRMMELAVAEGGGKLARVPGYRVAGKTGTSEVATGAGYTNSYDASFLGIAPADDPQVVIFITFHKPKTKFFGGDVAAPAFARIAADVLPALYLLPANVNRWDVLPLGEGGMTGEEVVVNDVATAIKFWSQRGIPVRFYGQGDRVVWTSAAAGSPPRLGEPVVLGLAPERAAMPDVKGCTLREALRQLAPWHVRVLLKGTGGWVVAQRPGPGRPISNWCELTLGNSRALRGLYRATVPPATAAGVAG